MDLTQSSTRYNIATSCVSGATPKYEKVEVLPSRFAKGPETRDCTIAVYRMQDEEDSVQVTHPHTGITVITLNRSSRRNAVDTSTAIKLYDAFVSFENDVNQKIAVFHGANGTFCAGYDLTTVGVENAENMPSVVDMHRTRAPMGPSRLQVKKPVICAVAGSAVAGGLELSLVGDMRIVEEDAIFGVFCRRWGVPLIDGGTVRLQAIIGLGRAMDMILTGRPVGAKEALEMGLANRVVPKGRSLEEAMTIAKQLLVFPQACMRADRDSCYHACYDARSFEDAMAFETRGGMPVIEAEAVAGAKRFSDGKGRHGSFSKL